MGSCGLARSPTQHNEQVQQQVQPQQQQQREQPSESIQSTSGNKPTGRQGKLGFQVRTPKPSVTQEDQQSGLPKVTKLRQKIDELYEFGKSKGNMHGHIKDLMITIKSAVAAAECEHMALLERAKNAENALKFSAIEEAEAYETPKGGRDSRSVKRIRETPGEEEEPKKPRKVGEGQRKIRQSQSGLARSPTQHNEQVQQQVQPQQQQQREQPSESIQSTSGNKPTGRQGKLGFQVRTPKPSVTQEDQQSGLPKVTKLRQKIDELYEFGKSKGNMHGHIKDLMITIKSAVAAAECEHMALLERAKNAENALKFSAIEEAEAYETPKGGRDSRSVKRIRETPGEEEEPKKPRKVGEGQRKIRQSQTGGVKLP
ncbi:uncharacterized protein LOC131696090 [Topomyia yanbarensis]|uniref:uncharacterized protein LOC131696090 n=1 Tax=Topomyia yanbarensis TaxID=2498891 RepID=UPI00273C7ACA|nr:uncharacterized protein LOC131696090 [Topomyia yanbarensis]